MAKRILFQTALGNGYITKDQLQQGEEYRAETNVSDERALLDLKILSEENLLKLYHDIYGHEIATNIKNIVADALTLKCRYKTLLDIGFMPVTRDSKVHIITAKPQNSLFAEDYIREATSYKGGFTYALITETNLKKLINKAFHVESENMEFDSLELSAYTPSKTYDVSENDSSTIVNLVNRILREAIENKISDIHFEPQADHLRVRYRDDGLLKMMFKLPKNIANQLVNRIKTMSNLDVNNSKIIQDGNARLDIFGKTIDIRVSVIPSTNGENAVIRILDQSKLKFDISMLGFSEENEKRFCKLIQKPQGMILLTGPTGSGKSTSLYAALSVLNTMDRCIITFEEPVEYHMDGIVQVQVNPAMGVTFPKALNSGLRQDIEVALVGEIRDRETAEIAFDAANTGHMVFSTLHTNSAASSILRLVKMGIEPYMVSRVLTAVINQRLARRICQNCKEEYRLEDSSPYRKILGCGDKEVLLHRGRGCDECAETGFKGRIAIQEFLIVNEEIGELLDNNATTHEIEQAAIRSGMKKIQQDGIDKSLSGLTTLDEIHRVVYFENL
ncbi:MAG: type II/IV secretion system protein [Clostridiaceae bacterium]|nr:type II/IV secretion system protein [Clostridiaceae bacterium]